MVNRGALFAFALALCISNLAWGQSSFTAYAPVVAACGTPPSTYSAGDQRPILQDVHGNLCLSAGGGGGLVSSVTGAGTVSCSPTTGAVVCTGTGLGAGLTSAFILVGNGSNVATGVAVSGDLTLANTGAFTLATVNSNVGSFTSANITVDAKGRITAAANGGAGGTVTSIATNNGITGGTITSTGTIGLATVSANTVLGALTATFPSGLAMPSCTDSGGNHLNYTSGTGFSCGTTASVGGTVTSVGLGVPASSLFGTSGTNPVTSSGTFSITTTGISGGIPYFDTTSTLNSSALLTNHAIVLGGGAGAAPSALGSLGTTTTLLHGAAAGAPTFGAVVTNDVTDANITYAKIQNVGASSLLGNPTGAPAATSEITLGSGLNFSGTTLVATGSGGTVTSIATNNGVTGGTITGTGTIGLASISANTVLGALTATTPSGLALPSCADSGGNHLNYTSGTGFSCGTTDSHAGTVTSVASGAGLAGGTITTTGTLTLDLSHANSWAAVQTFGDGDLSLSGSSSGNSVLHAPATGGGAITLPAGSVTLAALSVAQTWSETQTFGSTLGSINTQASATTYTLQASDCGETILFQAATAIALTTLNSLPPGCAIAIEQGSTGQITVGNGSGATMTSAHSYTKTFNAAGAIIGLFVDTNAGGSSAHFVLTGDGA